MWRKGQILTVGTILFLASGCASTVPLAVFQPKDGGNVRSFFRNGQAIGAIYGDSVFALAQVEPVSVTDVFYARLWLLIENHSSSPLLIEPLKCATLRVELVDDPKGRYATPPRPVTLSPESPTKILARISNDQAAASILAGIGAALEAAAVQPTASKTRTSDATGRVVRTSETTFNDQGEKRRAILSQRGAEAGSLAAWYDAFKNSVNEGILRRNTIFPGEAVNGYVYFRSPSPQPRRADRRYVVTLTASTVEQVVTFEPIEGE